MFGKVAVLTRRKLYEAESQICDDGFGDSFRHIRCQFPVSVARLASDVLTLWFDGWSTCGPRRIQGLQPYVTRAEQVESKISGLVKGQCFVVSQKAQFRSALKQFHHAVPRNGICRLSPTSGASFDQVVQEFRARKPYEILIEISSHFKWPLVILVIVRPSVLRIVFD